SVDAATRVNADWISADGRVIPRVFQGLPRDLQEQAMLRVRFRRLTRREAKERSIEEIHALQLGARFDIQRIIECLGRNTALQQFLIREEGDRLYSIPQVAPENLYIAGAWKAPRHTDDRNIGLCSVW